MNNANKNAAVVALKGIALATVIALSPAVSADTLFGLYGGATLWQPEVDGTVGQSDNGFDFSGDFSGGDSDSLSLYVAVEHFIPVLPNLMVRTTPVNWTGSSDSASGTLGGLITIDGEVDATLDVDMQDATLYYELLDNWASVDLGLTLRRLDGFVEATETQTQESDRLELSNVVPMLYGHVRFDLPFTGLAVGIRGNGVGFKESNLLDIEAYLHLEVDLLPAVDFGIQGGVRRLSLDIEDLDEWSSDATIEGAFVGLTAHF